MKEEFDFRSLGIYFKEKEITYSPSLEEYLKGIPIDAVIDVLGVENVQNYLRELKLKKLKNGK